MTQKQKRITAALQRIASKDPEGKLRCEAILKEARQDLDLRDEFEWDNTKAAQAHRLHQARNLIKAYGVHIQMVGGEPKEYAAYFSYREDRHKPGGGYTPIKKILKSKPKYQLMLQEALDDLRCFRKRYEVLKELSPVFAAIDKLVKK